MKKTKLLTSFVTLALVLSLGACGEVEEEFLGSEDEVTSQETSSGSSTGTNTDFNEDADGLFHNPTEFLEAISTECNYHVTLYYDVYETLDSYKITYGQYKLNPDYYWYYLQSYEGASYYAYDVYYMENAILMDEYSYNSYYGAYIATGYEQVYYDNGEGTSVYRFTTQNGYSYSASYWDSQYRLYDIVYSLILAYDYYELQNDITYVGPGSNYYGYPYDIYTMSTVDAMEMFLCLGTEFVFGNQSKATNAAYSFDFDGLYFYDDEQTLQANYSTYGVYYDDDDLTDSSLVYFADFNLEILVDSVGIVNDDGYCESIYNYYLS